MTVFFLGGVWQFGELMGKTTESWERAAAEIEVFLNDDITAVRNFSFTSKAAAFEEFKRLNRDSAGIMSGVGADALELRLSVSNDRVSARGRGEIWEV